MNNFPYIKLELLRGGAPHNQLLSPAIGYLALCGEAAPHTLHIPFEHRDIINSLLAFRYRNCIDKKESERLRKAELERLARQIGQILGSIPAFAAEVSGIEPPKHGDIIHLRLVLAGNELSLIPWELTQVPEGLPGTGLFLLLQPRIPISMTREVRGASRRQVIWDKKPRVLFATTSAGDFPPNTIEAHLLSLRLALESWIYDEWEINGWNLDEYPIDVIQYASVENIREKCLENDYTHVHILAHGCKIDEDAASRYGLMLHKSRDCEKRECVTGEQLTQALLSSRTHRGASDPVMVTLATCDSANQVDTVYPGGSVAHTLHQEGVPWVIASQFPLTVKGSVILATDFFADLFQGADPRMALHKIRQHLNTRFGDRHDWASIAAYASIPPDFDSQVEDFRQRAMRQQRNHAFALVDKAVFGWLLVQDFSEVDIGNSSEQLIHKQGDQLIQLKDKFTQPTVKKLEEIRKLLDESIDRMKGMEEINSDKATPRTKQIEAKIRLKNSEYWTIKAGLRKRIAELNYLEIQVKGEKTAINNRKKWLKDLHQAFDDYKEGLDQDIHVEHWLLVQYFVVRYVVYVLSDIPIQFTKREEILWKQALNAIELELDSNDPKKIMWAYSSMADFAMVRFLQNLHHAKLSLSMHETQTIIKNQDELISVLDGESPQTDIKLTEIKPEDVISQVESVLTFEFDRLSSSDDVDDVTKQLRKMLTVGDGIDTSIALFSTFRQFWRWHKWWLPEIDEKLYGKSLLTILSEPAYKLLLDKVLNKLCPD